MDVIGRREDAATAAHPLTTADPELDGGRLVAGLPGLPPGEQAVLDRGLCGNGRVHRPTFASRGGRRPDRSGRCGYRRVVPSRAAEVAQVDKEVQQGVEGPPEQAV